MNKKQLRKECLEKRNSMDKNKKRQLELEIQSRLIMSDEYRKADTVFVYVSKEDEIDTFGIINAAFANKKHVAVPVTNEDFSLSFYYINSLKELKPGRFDVLEPTDKADKAEGFSDSICVVPSLCCDLNGARVGYGKGCYDRFLKGFKGPKIALSYSENVVPHIESEKTDINVDMIVTDMFVKFT